MLKQAINGIVWRDIRWKYLKLIFSFILHCKPENNTQFQPTLDLTILCRITHFYQIWSVECLLCVLSRVMVKLLNVRDFFSMNPKNLWWFAILNTINTWVEGIYGKIGLISKYPVYIKIILKLSNTFVVSRLKKNLTTLKSM